MSRNNINLYDKFGYKTFILNSSVLIEKSSNKNYSISSEKFLNTLGIAIYFWIDSKFTDKGYVETFGSILKNQFANYDYEINKIYGFDVISKLYKSITSNEKIQKLPYCYYDFNRVIKWGVLLDETGYSNNRIKTKDGDYVYFKIYCMTRKIEKDAGFKDELPF